MVEYKAATASTPAVSSSSYEIVPLNKDGVPEGEPVRYRRVSEFIKALDVPSDTKFLEYRDKRYAVYGVAKYHADKLPNLHPEEDKLEFNKIIDKGARDAGIWNSAEWGTAVHAWTEDVDNGCTPTDPLATSPDFLQFGPAVRELQEDWRHKGALRQFVDNFEAMRRDVQAYLDLKDEYGLSFSHMEATLVIDEYRVAGTLDRLGNTTHPKTYHCDKPHVFDLKSGTVDLGKREKANQFGSYAKGRLYNHQTFERTDHGACQEMAYIIHLPKGNPAEAGVLPIPIDHVAEQLDVAHQVWTMHSKAHSWKKFGLFEFVERGIEEATTVAELDAFYDKTSQYWTPDHVNQAKEKKQNVA